MPRSGRGGKRQGKPGVAYPQRTDLNSQPVRTTASDTYGDTARRQTAQQAVPLPQAAPPPQPPPGSLGFTDPSRRPAEPVTAGLPLGAGPGPEALGQAGDPLVELKAIYTREPTMELAEAIRDLEMRR